MPKQEGNWLKGILNTISVVLILSGIGIIGYKFWYEPRQVTSIQTEYTAPKPLSPEQKTEKIIKVDTEGVKITNELKKNGFDMGFIWSDLHTSIGYKLPNFQESTKGNEELNQLQPKSLEEIISEPQEVTQRNVLIWDQYNIKSPILYAEFSDIFEKKDDSIQLDTFVNNDPVDSPVQVKLREGTVHLPFSPSPGEVGNSYIIGHSSNYGSVKSDFNFIFAPIIEKVQSGESFKIFDYRGRELTFRVFETKSVKEEDVLEAYKNFGDRRVVTLQGSILENVNGRQIPTKRYLVLAELVV